MECSRFYTKRFLQVLKLLGSHTALPFLNSQDKKSTLLLRLAEILVTADKRHELKLEAERRWVCSVTREEVGDRGVTGVSGERDAAGGEGPVRWGLECHTKDS